MSKSLQDQWEALEKAKDKISKREDRLKSLKAAKEKRDKENERKRITRQHILMGVVIETLMSDGTLHIKNMEKCANIYYERKLIKAKRNEIQKLNNDRQELNNLFSRAREALEKPFENKETTTAATPENASPPALGSCAPQGAPLKASATEQTLPQPPRPQRPAQGRKENKPTPR